MVNNNKEHEYHYGFSKKVQVRFGPNVDTGGSINEYGIEGKFWGFGASVGKRTGISTPIGEIKFKTDDCSIQ